MVRLAPTPAVLFRIGRAPDPLAFPPLAFSGSGRYDDPKKRLSVLYAAMDRRAAFMETLDSFRPDLQAIAERDEAVGIDLEGDGRPSRAVIPARYFTRSLIRFSAAAHQRWLDVRSPDTHTVLRDELSQILVAAGIGPRFVLGDLLSNNHSVTQLVAGWAIDQGFHGVAYASCHDPSLTCWAIFEGTETMPLESPQSVRPDDPDLRAVADLWNLEIPTASARMQFGS